MKMKTRMKMLTRDPSEARVFFPEEDARQYARRCSRGDSLWLYVVEPIPHEVWLSSSAPPGSGFRVVAVLNRDDGSLVGYVPG